jgi:hypothetical protein
MWKPRPYDPALCQRILDLATSGLERAQLAAALAVSERDFEAWAETHDTFAVALADAESRASAWFHEQHVKALQGNETSKANAWTKALAQRSGRSSNARRKTEDQASAQPVIRARINIPDNGRKRRRGPGWTPK